MTGKVALPVLWQFFSSYSSPEETSMADWRPIAKLIERLGLHIKRAKMIIQFSSENILLFTYVIVNLRRVLDKGLAISN